jgi:hypothetical protein
LIHLNAYRQSGAQDSSSTNLGDSQMPFLSKNIGVLDRALRVGVGVLLIALAVGGTIGFWGYIGVVPLLTGVVGNCPVYSFFGLSTCPRSGR